MSDTVQKRVYLRSDWMGDSGEPFDVSMLLGTVARAEFREGQDILTLTYADGRTVRVSLHQCDTHRCDRTALMLEQDREA